GPSHSPSRTHAPAKRSSSSSRGEQSWRKSLDELTPVRFARLSARSSHWRTRFERTKRNPSAAHFNRRLTDARGDFLRDATFVQMATGLRLALARRPGRRVPFGRRRSLRPLGT